MVAFHEYVWLDAKQEPRSKTQVLPDGEEPGMWNYDGSSTGQAQTDNSEVLLNPVRTYPDPFRDGNAFLVLCETLNPDGTPHATNTRWRAAEALDRHSEEMCMFGAEQEFFMVDVDTDRPLGFTAAGLANPQGDYYCGVGAGRVYGRAFAEDALAHALQAELPITGLNFEVAPGQCELQVCHVGIRAADDLIMLRYVLRRLGEMHGLKIDFSPKPILGDWNGSGCHVNFSTQTMREVEGGFHAIWKAVRKLGDAHAEHIAAYGVGNEERLTGKHETSSMTAFTSGVGDRSASVRIPSAVAAAQKGYLEDRRPAGNMDPYTVYRMIVETVLE
jgi:glutamine synthetase